MRLSPYTKTARNAQGLGYGRDDTLRRMPEYRRKLVRELRQRQTHSEQLLWQHLRSGQMDGLKIRRQRPIDRYIADFCCDAAKLVVEIDGAIHAGIDPQEYDAIRDKMMKASRYEVLRFSVDEVLMETLSVLERIRQTAKERIHSSPSPLAGEGVGG